MLKILILSDSVPLARNKPEKTRYEQTWPELLKNEGYVMNQVSIGGATSDDLYQQAKYYHQYFMPDIVIIQVGIVDCAPRFLTKTEKKIIENLPYIGIRLIPRLNNNFIKKIRKINYVDKKRFKQNLEGFKNIFQCKIIFIKIIPASDSYEKMLIGVRKNIQDYNSIIEKTMNITIDTKCIDQTCLMSDHHHLNEKGHSVLFKEIIKKIQDE